MNINEANRRAYFDALPRLRADYHDGRHYAVFVGGTFVGIHDSYRGALDKGYDSARDGVFLVKQITCDEEIQNVTGPITAF